MALNKESLLSNYQYILIKNLKSGGHIVYLVKDIKELDVFLFGEGEEHSMKGGDIVIRLTDDTVQVLKEEIIRTLE